MRRTKTLLLLILLLGLAVRLYNIDKPLYDYNQWKQQQSGNVVRNMYRGHGATFSEFSLAQPAGPDGNIRFQPFWELPLFHSVTVLLMKLFGYQELLGRLVSIMFALLAGWLLYLIVRRDYAEPVALLALLVYLLLPLQIQQTQTFTPFSSYHFVVLLAWYALQRWLAGGEKRWWCAAAAAIVFAVLVRKYSLPPLFFVMVAYAWRDGRRGWSGPGWAGLFAVLLVAAVMAVTVYAPDIPDRSYAHLGGYSILDKTPQQIAGSFARYARTIAVEVLTPAGCLLALVGLSIGWRREREKLLPFLTLTAGTLAVCLCYLLWQEYDLMILGIPAALGIALTLAALWPGRRVLTTALLGTLVLSSAWQLYQWKKEDRSYRLRVYRQFSCFADAVQAQTPADAVVLYGVLPRSQTLDPRYYYLTDRRGGIIPFSHPEFARVVAQCAEHGVGYLVTPYAASLAADSIAAGALAGSYRKLYDCDGVAVYDLQYTPTDAADTGGSSSDYFLLPNI